MMRESGDRRPARARRRAHGSTRTRLRRGQGWSSVVEVAGTAARGNLSARSRGSAWRASSARIHAADRAPHYAPAPGAAAAALLAFALGEPPSGGDTLVFSRFSSELTGRGRAREGGDRRSLRGPSSLRTPALVFSSSLRARGSPAASLRA